MGGDQRGLYPCFVLATFPWSLADPFPSRVNIIRPYFQLVSKSAIMEGKDGYIGMVSVFSNLVCPS